MNRYFLTALLSGANALLLSAASAASLPSGGHYVAGKGEIGKASQSVTVKQSSTIGIIDWNKFSVGSKNSVTFDNGSGATLNRVTGETLSTIAGSLHATGSLYLMNSSGVIVSGTGRVVTGGSFVATTNPAFGSDDSRFKIESGRVINRGTITTGGMTSLNSRDVISTGTIRASKVNLKARKKLTIYGDITAQRSDGNGGTVIGTGRHVMVGGNANISVDGAHGGTVLIGGDIHGGAIASDDFVNQAVKNARTTSIAKGAHISANGSSDYGGNIVIWSDGDTTFAGRVSAKGQTAGGFAEVSSHDLLGFTGHANLTSNGAMGTLLLDPFNVTISSGSNSHESGFKANGNNSVINVKTLTKALTAANVEVSTGKSGKQAGNIDVDAAITWSTASTLTLDAFDNVDVKHVITNKGKGNLVLRADSTGTGKGTVAFSGSGEVDFSKSTGVVIIVYNPSDNRAGSKINTTSYTAPTNFSKDVKTNKSVSGQMAGMMLVNTVYDLQNIQNNANGDYALGRDINASATNKWNLTDVNGKKVYEGFTPIASSGFFGIFDGFGNKIENLYENLGAISGEAGGLFAEIGSSALVADVSLTGVSMKFGADSLFSGALVGYNEGGTVSHSVSTGTITYAGGVTVGGLIGQNDGTATDDTSSVAVTATSTQDGNTAGGLIGLNYGAVESSHATGAVLDKTQNASVGGLVGFNNSLEGAGYISDSYATGAVTGGTSAVGGGASVGGLVGYNIGQGSSTDGIAASFGVADNSSAKPGEIVSSYATGKVTDNGAFAYVGGLVGDNDQLALLLDDRATGSVIGGTDCLTGGLVGSNNGTIEESFAVGTVLTGEGDEVGGLAGLNAGIVESSFATGAVTAGSAYGGDYPRDADAGGLVGRNQGSIAYAYATGAVKVGASSTATGAIAYAGGLVGSDYGGTLDQVYSTGKVSGGRKSKIGGLSAFSGEDAKDAYWDTTTSGVTKSAEGKALTSANLKGKLPSGFSKNHWKVSKTSLPYLSWQKTDIPKVTPVQPTAFFASLSVLPSDAEKLLDED
jgi:filamentous hemagglutinin family protein